MFGTKKPVDAAHRERLRDVRSWTRERLELPDEVTVMVTELTCSEPGCPPVETVIAVLEAKGRTRQAKIALPVASVNRDHVDAADFVATASPEPGHGAQR